MNKHLKWRLVAVPFLVAALAGAATLLPRRHLEEPKELDATLRAAIHERMRHHGERLFDLYSGIILLDFAAVQGIAQELGEHPRLARPLNLQDANAALPERFFELQDQLTEKLKRLEDASRSKDGAAVAQAFGAMTETCVACHSAYLQAWGPKPILKGMLP